MQRESLVQQRAAIQMQWRDVYLLAASPAESEEKLTLFSPLLFQNSLTRLIHWQPSAQGGEMALISAWDAIPLTFVQLAAQGMNVSRFSLSAEGTELLLTLKLERLNDDRSLVISLAKGEGGVQLDNLARLTALAVVVHLTAFNHFAG